MIAKTGTPHTIGEKLILPCVKEVIEKVMCQSSTLVLSTVPLSNDKMGDDVESQLVQILSRTDHVLQIDEPTVRDNEALSMGT